MDCAAAARLAQCVCRLSSVGPRCRPVSLWRTWDSGESGILRARHNFRQSAPIGAVVATGVVETLVAKFTQRPAYWAVLVACSLPLTMVLFVALPLLRRESR